MAGQVELQRGLLVQAGLSPKELGFAFQHLFQVGRVVAEFLAEPQLALHQPGQLPPGRVQLNRQAGSRRGLRAGLALR